MEQNNTEQVPDRRGDERRSPTKKVVQKGQDMAVVIFNTGFVLTLQVVIFVVFCN